MAQSELDITMADFRQSIKWQMGSDDSDIRSEEETTRPRDSARKSADTYMPRAQGGGGGGGGGGCGGGGYSSLIHGPDDDLSFDTVRAVPKVSMPLVPLVPPPKSSDSGGYVRNEAGLLDFDTVGAVPKAGPRAGPAAQLPVLAEQEPEYHTGETVTDWSAAIRGGRR